MNKYRLCFEGGAKALGTPTDDWKGKNRFSPVLISDVDGTTDPANMSAKGTSCFKLVI